MGRCRRFSVADSRTLWRGWKSGLTLTAIGQMLDRRPATVLQVLRRHGGFEPARRRRATRVLQSTEREEISRGLAANQSLRQIARTLGRSASTISREIARHGGRQAYRGAHADSRAWQRARRPQACRLTCRPRLRRWVAAKLRQDWSPRQIATGLQQAFPADSYMRVSHETIYRTLFVQARGALRQELQQHLRRANFMRRPRQNTVGHPAIVDGISIRERPAEAEDRAVPGHWEGDLLMGDVGSQIATLVERHSRFVMLIKIDSKETQVVTQALARKIRELPKELRRSLTWDRGSEMAAHKDFTLATDVQVYFCDPRSPWQRGSNENTNGLLRQYFPKGEDVSGYSQAYLDKIALRLNGRPRETLDWHTPLEALKKTVASTP